MQPPLAKQACCVCKQRRPPKKLTLNFLSQTSAMSVGSIISSPGKGEGVHVWWACAPGRRVAFKTSAPGAAATPLESPPGRARTRLVLVLHGPAPALLAPLVLRQLLEVEVAKGGGGEGPGAWGGAQGQGRRVCGEGPGGAVRAALARSARRQQLRARQQQQYQAPQPRCNSRAPTKPLRSAWQRPSVCAPLSATISRSSKPMRPNTSRMCAAPGG